MLVPMEAIMFGLGGPEIIIVLVLGLMLFSAKKLPELGGGLGLSIREFKRGVSDLRDDLEVSLKDDPFENHPFENHLLTSKTAVAEAGV
jgi:sec-independent protein translocase protein TatA